VAHLLMLFRFLQVFAPIRVCQVKLDKLNQQFFRGRERTLEMQDPEHDEGFYASNLILPSIILLSLVFFGGGTEGTGPAFVPQLWLYSGELHVFNI
jgi:hypothetical protein